MSNNQDGLLHFLKLLWPPEAADASHDVVAGAYHPQAQASSPARCARTLLSAEIGRGRRRRLGRLQVRPGRPGDSELRPEPRPDIAGADPVGLGLVQGLKVCQKSPQSSVITIHFSQEESKQSQQDGLCQEKQKRKTQPMFHSAFKNVNTGVNRRYLG